MSSISSVKNSPANAIKISAVILNLTSDKPDSDKNRKREITRFFLAVAYENCVTMKHFRFSDKIETSLNLFSLFISMGLSFRNLRLGVMKTQTPENK